MKIEIITAQSLEAVVQPLVELLNNHYATGEVEEYLIPLLGRFGEIEINDHEVSIELPDNIVDNERAVCAVATLLKMTGSQATWISPTSPDDAMIHGPLRFRLTKTVAWAGYFWKWTRDLVIDHAGEDLDTESATRQVAELVAHLGDEARFIELGPVERALF